MAVADLERARVSLADEWRAQNPQTAEDVARFYREAQGLRADLDAWHETAERRLWTDALVAAATTIDAQRVLDVGAGAGHDLMAVRERCPAATDLWAVEPNHGLRHVLQEQEIAAAADIAAITSWDFDVISCIDVFEHVPEPDALLMAIIDRLRMGGIFVEATATTDIGTPLHLPGNAGWSPGRLLDRFGFMVREQIGRLRVWQRVEERRTSEPSALVCAYRALSVETAESLLQLVARGWRRSIHRGDALISRVRSIAVSTWLRETDGDVFLMFDDDIVFSPEDAEKVVDLARKTEGIACAAYPVRGGTHLACRALDNHIVFGPEAEPVEILWAGTGFMAAHRTVCEAIIAEHQMPLCHPDQAWAFWPLFQPLVLETEDAQAGRTVAEYLSEDWAFCFRARQLGYQVWLDPSVILTHLGQTAFTVHTMQGATPEPLGTEIIG